MKKLWEDDAWAEYLEWQTKDKSVLKKINILIKDIDRNGYECTGKPEPLTGDLADTGVFVQIRKTGLFSKYMMEIWK